MTDSSPRALVLIAEGTEEMEFTIVADVLRRGEIDVVVAGVEGSDPVVCSRGIMIVPDVGLDEADGVFDIVALPGGGEGSQRFAASGDVGELLHAQMVRGGKIAAICAAPSALVAHGIGAGRRMTSHPSVREVVAAQADYVEEPVVEDEWLITSRGPGTAFEFAFAVLRSLRGDEVVARVREPMMFPG